MPIDFKVYRTLVLHLFGMSVTEMYWKHKKKVTEIESMCVCVFVRACVYLPSCIVEGLSQSSLNHVSIPKFIQFLFKHVHTLCCNHLPL